MTALVAIDAADWTFIADALTATHVPPAVKLASRVTRYRLGIETAAAALRLGKVHEAVEALDEARR